MRELKDSGIEWVKKIPSRWSVNKCKYISSFINGYSFDSNKLVVDYIFPVVRIGDIKDGKINYSSILGIKSNKMLQQYETKPNDILLAMSGATVGKIGLVNTEDRGAYINQRVGIIRSDISKFLFYCLSTNSFIEYILLNAFGSAQPNVSNIIFNNFKIPFPSKIEQEKISDFLDKKCSEIDSLSADIQNQIDTLEEYKKSVITEAVTKGLNPNVEMKDSGIEWCTEIPCKWNTSRLGYECYIRARLGWKGLKADEYIDDGYAFLSAFNIQNNKLVWDDLNYISQKRYDESPEIKLNIGDVLIVKDGAGIGKTARIDSLPCGDATTNSSLGVISCYDGINYRYCSYYFQSALFKNKIIQLLNGMGVPHLTQEVLRNLKIIVPSLKEQLAISDYLDSKCTEIEKTISEKQQQLETLEEYKKSLIYEYVTGKKEIA